MTTYRKNGKRFALITGASRGLGLTLAHFLAARGFDLIITARGGKRLEATKGKLQSYGVLVETQAGDISDATHRQRLAEAVRSRGGLDLLVNNASALGPSPMPDLAGYPLESLRQVFETNTIAPLALVQLLRPYLAKRRGLVINISSDAANGGYAGWGGYGASKAALDLLSLTLANELAAEHIAVVSVDPGDMRTDMQQAAFPGEDISDRPQPDVTVPFWAWLLGQEPEAVNGNRFQAQADLWGVPA